MPPVYRGAGFGRPRRRQPRDFWLASSLLLWVKAVFESEVEVGVGEELLI